MNISQTKYSSLHPILLILIALFLPVSILTAAYITHSSILVLLLIIVAMAVAKFHAKNSVIYVLLVILALEPFMPFVKVYTGSRYGPILLNIALFSIIVFSLFNKHLINRLESGKLKLPIFLFIMIGLVQVFNPNILNLRSGLEGFRILSFFCLAYFLGQLSIKSIKAVKQIMIILVVTSTAIAFNGIRQFLWPSSSDWKFVFDNPSSQTFASPGRLRAFSTMSSPSHLGLFLSLSILLLFSFLFLYPRKKRLLLILLIILQTTCLLFTIVRTAWIIVPIGLSALMLLNILNKRPRATISFIFIIFILVLSLFYLFSNIPDQDPVKNYLSSFAKLDQESHFIGRIDAFKNEMIPAIIKNPLGYGAGSSSDNWTIERRIGFSSHSMYLNIALDLGIIGLVLFLIILINFMKNQLKSFFKLQDSFLRITAAWMFAFSLGLSIGGMASPLMGIYPVNLYFWLINGAIANFKKIDDELQQIKIKSIIHKFAGK